MNVLRFTAASLAALFLATALTGCATRRIDWSSRVGTYTFDQAVAELGPPDKQAKLTDGVIVAEWLTRRGYHEVYNASGFYDSARFYGYPSRYSTYPPHYVDTYSPDYFLRLTFGPEGRLQSWKKLTK